MQNHLRQILVYLNMFPINQPEVLISHAIDRFDQEGNLTDVPTRERIIGLLQNLVDWALRIGPKCNRQSDSNLQVLMALPSRGKAGARQKGARR